MVVNKYKLTKQSQARISDQTRGSTGRMGVELAMVMDRE